MVEKIKINLEKKYLEIEKEIKVLTEKYKEIEKKLDSKINLKPIPQEFRDNEGFLENEKWISEMHSLYPNETIVYTKRGAELILLTHSNNNEILLKNIDELFDKNLISKDDKIFFR